jgi:hypothetical protein
MWFLLGVLAAVAIAALVNPNILAAWRCILGAGG